MDTRTRRSPWELVILFAYPILLFGLAAFSVLVVPWACLSRDQGRHRSMRTQARIQQAAAVANQWHGQFGRFPPADEAGLARLLHMSAGALPNDSNVGVEVLGLAFAWPEFHAEAGFGAEDASNTDADAYAPAWGGEAPLAELRDGWGNPLAYFVHTRYAQADANPAAYVLGPDHGGRVVRPRPWPGDEGGFAEPRGFQIYSFGPDGTPNTEDDLKAWE